MAARRCDTEMFVAVSSSVTAESVAVPHAAVKTNLTEKDLIKIIMPFT
jgi:hypothetical protein